MNTHASSLFGREDYVSQSLFDQKSQRLVVARSLGKPKRLRLSSKTGTKICETPNDLGKTISFVAEWKNRVAIGLSNRVPMTRTQRGTFAVGFKNAFISSRLTPRKP